MTAATNREREGKHLIRENAAMVRAAAKIGFLARGLVWITIGVLAVRLAIGGSDKKADRSGALQAIRDKPFGTVMLVIVAIAFAAYALYNLLDASFDFERKGAGDRLVRLVRGVLYGWFAWTAYRFASAAKLQDNNKQSTDFTATLMKKPMGPWLVGIVGLVLIAIGLYNGREAFGERYEEGLKTFELSRTNEKAVGLIARVGLISRMVVFAGIGLLFIQAARTHNAKEASGLDGALRRLLAISYGRPLVAALGVGLVAFGLYSLVEAKYRRIETS
jgi:hypothetical protein